MLFFSKNLFFFYTNVTQKWYNISIINGLFTKVRGVFYYE